jgi:hypothetical protein
MKCLEVENSKFNQPSWWELESGMVFNVRTSFSVFTEFSVLETHSTVPKTALINNCQNHEKRLETEESDNLGFQLFLVIFNYPTVFMLLLFYEKSCSHLPYYFPPRKLRIFEDRGSRIFRFVWSDCYLLLLPVLSTPTPNPPSKTHVFNGAD